MSLGRIARRYRGRPDEHAQAVAHVRQTIAILEADRDYHFARGDTATAILKIKAIQSAAAQLEKLGAT